MKPDATNEPPPKKPWKPDWLKIMAVGLTVGAVVLVAPPAVLALLIIYACVVEGDCI